MALPTGFVSLRAICSRRLQRSTSNSSSPIRRTWRSDRASLAVEVREYEPSLALFAGGDGLGVYRRLIPAAHAALAPGGFLVLEIGCGQQPAVEGLLAQAGFQQPEFLSDLQAIPRVAVARR